LDVLVKKENEEVSSNETMDGESDAGISSGSSPADCPPVKNEALLNSCLIIHFLIFY
jgi:hypothetical protein